MQKITAEQYQNLYSYILYQSPRKPAGFKSTSKIVVEEAWEEWNDLQELGWTEVSHNFD